LTILGETIIEKQTLNYLEVKKIRSTDIINGTHILKFSSDDIAIFPRATAVRRLLQGD